MTTNSGGNSMTRRTMVAVLMLGLAGLLGLAQPGRPKRRPKRWKDPRRFIWEPGDVRIVSRTVKRADEEGGD
jgi:hypothetical protein